MMAFWSQLACQGAWGGAVSGWARSGEKPRGDPNGWWTFSMGNSIYKWMRTSIWINMESYELNQGLTLIEKYESIKLSFHTTYQIQSYIAERLSHFSATLFSPSPHPGRQTAVNMALIASRHQWLVAAAGETQVFLKNHRRPWWSGKGDNPGGEKWSFFLVWKWWIPCHIFFPMEYPPHGPMCLDPIWSNRLSLFNFSRGPENGPKRERGWWEAKRKRQPKNWQGCCRNTPDLVKLYDFHHGFHPTNPESLQSDWCIFWPFQLHRCWSIPSSKSGTSHKN